ncbi:hypothetical protein ACF0H5_023338 [Mactra antiquata]
MNTSSAITISVNETDTQFTWEKILSASILYSITLITIAGNILVLIAVKMERKLQTSFNYYIVNLAITDAAVAATAMSFKATHTVLGYWPFGEFLCGVWIFFDYGMTFVSVFTLILISVDRFWCVAWSVHYKHHHSKKKCIISIVAVWLFMLVLWVPPCLLDRIRNSEPDDCFWDPSLNMELVFIVATLGHHGPCCMMIFCYTYVFIFMRKRASFTDKSRRSAVDASNVQTEISVACVSAEVPSNNNELDDSINSSRDIRIIRESRAVKERRIFLTLSCIIVAYVILWTPFHIIFDIAIAEPLLIPTWIWEVAFWMTYFNSTVNPFMYAFSSPDFKAAFKRILCIHKVQCNCCSTEED